MKYYFFDSYSHAQGEGNSSIPNRSPDFRFLWRGWNGSSHNPSEQNVPASAVSSYTNSTPSATSVHYCYYNVSSGPAFPSQIPDVLWQWTRLSTNSIGGDFGTFSNFAAIKASSGNSCESF